MSVKVTKSGPGIKHLDQQIREIKASDVLVGIPAAKTIRPNEPINNASLLYLHTHGSPLQNIPPRPVLEPSIEHNSKLITPHLGKAAQSVLQNRPEEAKNELERAGTIAANGAKRYFTDPANGWAPNAPSTIREKGSDQPLINLGKMRAAITYVVRQKGAPQESPESQRPSVAAGEQPAAPEVTPESVATEALEVAEDIPIL